ncbi:Uncharacterised protein [Porphyromonas macacae]|uniref:Uncharacterized protein n=1 Tax=Porphyromonas macacae TaxID=28115 RepID=A0A379DFB2_9PORP|nr:Uncharacterised protein [Porphyromonas macacae]
MVQPVFVPFADISAKLQSIKRYDSASRFCKGNSFASFSRAISIFALFHSLFR